MASSKETKPGRSPGQDQVRRRRAHPNGRLQLLPIKDKENKNNTPGRKSQDDQAEVLDGIEASFGGQGRETPCSPPGGFRLTVEQALDLAFSYYDSGRLSEAEQLCRLVLQRIPHQVDAMQLLGALLNQTGQYAEALQFLRESVRQAPGHAHLHNNLGMALHGLKKYGEAVSEFNRALEIRPDFPKAYNNLGVSLMKLGRIDDAIAACKQAIKLQGDFKQAYNNLALALKKKGQLERAIESYKEALEIDPEYAEALSNLGMALIAQGKFKQAAAILQKAVSLAPLSQDQKHPERDPNFVVQAHNNLGNALMELRRFAEAKTAFERAIEIDPECAEAHHNRSLVLLLTGQFKQGWAEYEWRFRHSGFSTPLRPFSQEWWNGSAESVQKLLIWAEQGIGDEVQFSGLIRHIVPQGMEVVIECDQRLVPLLQRSFARLERAGTIVVGRTDPPAALLEDPSITHQIPMGSIPRVLGLSPSSMSFQKPFMVPDEKLRDRFRGEYKADGNPMLVGISWRSGNKQEGMKRSIELEHWGPILKIAGARFVNLQYGQCSRELQEACNRFGVEVLEDKKVNPLIDLETFVAQMAALDLVISVDNSTVHFAGALGIEVWTMLPTVPDWRWGLEGDRTRWYPTMRLFRQEEPGKWGPIISSVAAELTSLLNPGS